MRLALTVDLPVLDRELSWAELEALMVELGHRAPAQVLALVLDEAQERLVELVCGPRRAPRAGREAGGGQPAPFECPGCRSREGFVRKGRRTRPRTLRTAAGVLKLRVWHVGCTRAGCRKVFSPLLVMLRLSGKRRTDRLTLDLAELGTQMSFARSAAVDRLLAGTGATATTAHQSMADLAAVLAGDGQPEPGLPSGHDDSHHDDGHHDGDGHGDDGHHDDGHHDGDGHGDDGHHDDGHHDDGHGDDGHHDDGHGDDGHGDGDGDGAAGSGRAGDPGPAGPGTAGGRAFFRDPPRVLGPAITRPLVVLLDGTGARAGAKKNGVPVNLAIGLTGRSGPPGRRRAHTHLLGLTVNEDWSMMGAQLATVHPPALAVVDGETEITVLAQRLWPDTPIQRCWWHYADPAIMPRSRRLSLVGGGARAGLFGIITGLPGRPGAGRVGGSGPAGWRAAWCGRGLAA
jgi:hypothetical protein